MRLTIPGTESVANAAAAVSPEQMADTGAHRFLQLVKALNLTELRVELDAGIGAVWCFQLHRARPNFTISLLKDIRSVQRLITDFHRDFPHDARRITRFLIWASDVGGVFNLGGDLSHFVHLIEQRDIPRLKAYAMACVDVCFANYSGFHADVIVGALVAGDALGGGFESALSCDFIIAEEAARFGLPEILYGLFPGMGAYSFLSRRIGQAKAESLILDGGLYDASKVKEIGLIEGVSAAGQGRAEMERHLAKLSRRFEAALSIYKARRRTFPVCYRELSGIVEDWISTAAQLSARDLRKMKKLANAQDGRLEVCKYKRAHS